MCVCVSDMHKSFLAKCMSVLMHAPLFCWKKWQARFLSLYLLWWEESKFDLLLHFIELIFVSTPSRLFFFDATLLRVVELLMVAFWFFFSLYQCHFQGSLLNTVYLLQVRLRMLFWSEFQQSKSYAFSFFFLSSSLFDFPHWELFPHLFLPEHYS